MPSRRRRVGLYFTLGVVLVLGIGLLIARWYFSGPRLARFIIDTVFKNIRGKMVIDRVEWPFNALLTRNLPAVVHGLKVYDPHGTLVLDLPEIHADVDWLAIALGRHDLTAENVVIKGGMALIREIPSDAGDPLHPFEVGFIAAFQPDPAKIVPREGPPTPGPIIYLHDLALSGVAVHLEFRAWNAHVYGVEAEGFLRQSFRDPLLTQPDFSYALSAHVPFGTVEFAKMHFDLVDVRANRFGQYPHAKDTLAFNATARTLDGADVRIDGQLAHIYDPDPEVAMVTMRIDAYEAGLLLYRLGLGYLGGSPAGTLHLDGKMRGPKLTAQGWGIALVLPVPVIIDHAVLGLDLASMDLELDHAALRGLRGQAEARGKGNLTTYTLSSGSLTITTPLSVGPYLPRDVAREIGTQLSGQVHVIALPYMLNADKVNLQLGRLNVHGGVKLLGGELRTTGLALTMPEGAASVSGALVPKSGKVALDFKLTSPNLEPVLKRLDLPLLARGIDIQNGTVRGTLAAPLIAGRAALVGLPLTPRLDTEVSYQHAPGGGRLDVTRLTANPMGGSASASGSVSLGGRPRLADVRLEASGLDLAHVPGAGGLLQGSGRVDLTVSGPFDRPRGKLAVEAEKLALGGHDLGSARLRATADERRGVHLEELHAGGPRGTVDLTGNIGWAPYPLALDLHAKDVALSTIPLPKASAGTRPLDLDGRLGADLHLAGTARRPTAAGKIFLAGLAVFDTILGAGALQLTEEGGGRVHVTGRLFQNRVALDLSVAVTSVGGPLGIDVRGRITLHKVDLDELFAEELSKIGAHAWVSGWVDVRTAPTLVAELHVTDARLELEGTDAEGRPAPIVVANQGEIAARYDGGQGELTFLTPAVLASDAGNVTLEGSASPRRLALRLRGDVELHRLELFARRWLDGARGRVSVDVALGGSQEKPTLDGKVAFVDAAVTPRGQEAELRVPGGELVFSLNELRASGITVEVEGQRLTIDGTAQLKALRPVAIDATVSGRIAGKALEIIGSEQITHAAGSAAVRATIHGSPQNLSVQGQIDFDQPLEIAPRALRREIVLGSGRISFSQSRVTIERVRGTIDEGSLEVSGAAVLSPRLRGWLRFDVKSGFSHRIPEVLEVELATGPKGVTVAYDNGALSVSGDIDVVDGRYTQPIRFDRFASNIAFPERTTETSEPFWKGSQLLADMQLDLNINTKGTFAVKNELVDLTLKGKLNLSGTPPRPIFSGEVESLGEGSVHIPATKIREFVVSLGRVDFSPYAIFPTQTPTVLLRADAPLVDLNGTEHRVYLEITGTLSRYEWKLWTSTGLTQAQTMALITFGRVTDELRARVRGGTQPTASDSSNGPLTTATGSATDEVLNELSGDLLDALIADTLRAALNLDCFNLSVSGTSVRASACKKLGDIFTFTGQYEQGLGWYKYDAGLTMRPSDNLSFVLQQWGQKSQQEAEGTQNALRLQLKYNFTLR